MRLRVFFAAVFAVVLATNSPQAAQPCKPIDSPLNFQKLSGKIQECKIRRIEELLPLLPPDFRSRYVFIYASRSLQGASPLYPRVILFGLDATFILTFAGHPLLQGFESLETAEFDSSQKKFNFRSISFPAEQSNIKESEKEAIISESNPAQCRMCHRDEPRPIWDPYKAWPGVYGSIDDIKPPREEEQYQKFQQQIFMKFGRYRFFESWEKYPDHSWYYDYFREHRPNLQFGVLLSLLNSQSISREIQTNKKLFPYRYALLASLACNNDYQNQDELAQVLPSFVTMSHPKSYSQISDEVKQGILRSDDEREQRQLLLLTSLKSEASLKKWDTEFKSVELEFLRNTARFRYVMEVAGVSFPSWSMEFGSKNYVFFAGPGAEIGELGLYLWKDLLDPVEDKNLYTIYKEAWDERSEHGMKFWYGKEDLCKKLQEKSLKTLQTLNTSALNK